MDIWDWYWLGWFIVMLVSFGVVEGIAIYRKEKEDTLSESVWQLLRGWARVPFTILFIGLFVWLFMHFFFGY